MPLLKNTNQPYFPDPNSPASIACNGTYCYPINQGDKIYQQWYQTPCGNNEIADPLFSNATYGGNLITNGTFATDLSGWTAVDWVWDSGQAKGPTMDATNSLTQTVAITSFELYRVTFTLSGLSPGDSIRLYLGGLSGWYVFDENGSYDEIIRASFTTSDIVFMAEDTNLANALIDNVTLEHATWGDWYTNSTWTLDITNGTACANASGTGLLEEAVADYIVADDYYQLTYTVNMTAGSITPYIANVAGDAVTSSGTYTVYLTPTLAGVVSFLPSSGFVGCISAPDLRALRNDYLFEIVDSDGDRFNISDYFEYYEDKVTLASPVFDLLELQYGCYTIEAVDRCLIEGDELIVNGNFAEGVTGWTRNNGNYQYDFSGGECTFIFDPITTGTDKITNGNFASGNAGWTFSGWTIGTDATHTPGNTSPLSRSITITTPPTPPSVLYIWVCITMSGRTAGSFTVTLSNATSSSYADNGTWCFRIAPTIGGSVTFSINPTSNFDGTIDDIKVVETPTSWAESPILYNTINSNIVAGNYQMSFDITDITATGPVWCAAVLLGMTVSLTKQYTVASHTVSIPNYDPGAQLPYLLPSMGEVDSAGGSRSYVGSMTVDNVSLVRVEPFDATYVSDCLNYQFDHLNTQLLTGTCDQNSFGFDFTNTDFVLQMRAEVRGLNPVYNKQKNIAQFGNGNARVTYADETKTWLFVTGFMNESAHDCLATIIDCDHFIIGNPGGNGIEYVAQADDYTPTWSQDGSYSLAPVSINLRLKTGGQKFNRHT